MDAELRGRAVPGRFLVGAVDERVAGVAGLVLLVIATRVPFRTRSLMNWDAVQFALGMRQFDVFHHQPHPPGYPGYIALGRLLEALTGDANSALVALSIAGECAGVTLAFLFARELFGRFAGWAAALAMSMSPLFWFYGEVANSYALEPALTLGVAWLCHRIWNGEAGLAVPAAISLGMAGALRPSTTVLLAPLFIVSLWRAGSTAHLRRGMLALGCTVVAWGLPLVIATGGPLRYFQATFQLGDSATSETAVWRNPAALPVSARAVLSGMTWELGAFVVVLVFGLLVAPYLLGRPALPRSWVLFAATWIAPGLATFLFVHIGQVVYVQVFIAAFFLVLGPALAQTAAALGRPRLAPVLLGAGIAAGIAMFFLPADTALATQLRSHDERTDALVTYARGLDPETTLLVTDAGGSGSYRTAQYYLPLFHRAAIQRDQSGHLGEIYGDVYEPWNARRTMAFEPPAATRTYVFMDVTLLQVLGDRSHLRRVLLGDGPPLYTWTGPAPFLYANLLWLAGPVPDRHPLRPS